MMEKKKGVDPYTLKSTDSFASKAKDIFGCLQTLEDKHAAHEKARKDYSSGDESDQGLIKSDPSQEDSETIKPAFKKPTAICQGQGRSTYQGQGRSTYRGQGRSTNQRRPFKRSGGRMPDFNDGPVKWKKYSLEDVDMLDDSKNRQAAYAFLEERRKLREGETAEEKVDIQSTACSKGQFTFSKRSKVLKSNEMSNSSSDNSKNESKFEQKLNLNVTEAELNDDVKEDNSKSEEMPSATIFKSRKFGKRNIRSRDKKNQEDEEDIG